DGHRRADVAEDGRFDEAAPRRGNRIPAQPEEGTLLLSRLDVAQDLGTLLVADDGADFGRLVQRIADFDLSGSLHDAPGEFAGDFPVDQEPAAAVAALPHVEVDAEDDRIEGGVQ